RTIDADAVEFAFRTRCRQHERADLVRSTQALQAACTASCGQRRERGGNESAAVDLGAPGHPYSLLPARDGYVSLAFLRRAWILSVSDFVSLFCGTAPSAFSAS